MICTANKCDQGREPCTRTECGYGGVLDDQDRRALYAPLRTSRPSFVPQDAQITVESWPSLLSPQERCIFACIDRWGFPVATALVIFAVIALFVVANWPMLRWALN